jgi:hypothetical protein
MYSNKESEIKKNHEDLEKKQLNVDKLNKKFGELTKNKGGEDEGLFEVKIKELQSELSNLSKEIQEAEQEWIVKKTNLVSKANVLNNIEEECVDKRSKKMILEHKKLRLNKNYEMHEKEIREVEISLKNLRYDMNKYNGQLGKNVSHKEKLEREFFDDEIEFREKLKQMENEAVRLELEIEVIREEKADTLTQIMEVERQINLWDRKITLEEKMQEIIKPDKGIKEIEEMKSLIHRQDLLYIKLKQEQEKVIKSMETAIQRRDFIKLRYPIEKNGYSSGYASKDGNGKQSTKSPIQSTTGNQKELNDLKEHVKRVLSRKNNIIQDLEQNRRIMDDVRQNIENVEYQQRELQSKAMIYQNEYFKNKLKSNSLFCKTLQNQEAAKILDENRPKPRKREEMAKALEEHRSQTELMEGILKNFKDTHPEWDEIVSKALEF